MSTKFLLTAFSKDRPGIVADISQVIFDNGCNLEDSSMTYLAGEFAILLLLSVPYSADAGEILETLSVECRRLEREKDITAYIRPVSVELVTPRRDVKVRTISVEGLDQAGIVYRISRFLADAGINILTLNSEVSQSPESGAALYRMTIQVEVPAGMRIRGLEDELEKIGDRLHVDVLLK